MRVLIIDTVYQGYLHWLYQTNPGLENLSYDEQIRATNEGGFHTAAVWANPLRALGHEVMDVWADHAPLQIRWCIENGHADIIKLNTESSQTGEIVLPPPSQDQWHEEVVREQVKKFQPDILWIANVYLFAKPFLDSVRGCYRIAVGEITSQLPSIDYGGFDVMVSAAMTIVEKFRAHGLKSELLLHGFFNRMLDGLAPPEKKHGLVFIGSLQDDRAGFLMALGRALGLELWSGAPWSAEEQTELGIKLHPPIFGHPMYQTLRDAKIVFNKHLNAVGDFAANQRLYEATGVGSMLLTDAKANLADLFEPGLEVIAYRDLEECIDLAKFYLENDNERQTIAQAGCERTLSQHTVFHRADDIMNILERHGPASLF